MHEAQNNKLIRGIILATESFVYIHGVIWSISVENLAFHYEYLYIQIRQYILRKMFEMVRINVFPETISSNNIFYLTLNYLQPP